MRDRTDLIDLLDALIARAERACDVRQPLLEMDDLLSAGYAGALAGEARMTRLAQDRDDLLDSGAVGAQELRLLVGEHRALERGVARLRVALERLQCDFAALGGAAVHGA